MNSLNWVSTQHQLPIRPEPVLVALKQVNGRVEYRVAHYFSNAKLKGWHTKDRSIYTKLSECNRTVTHWMAIPTVEV